jgi:hypothetical protein
MVALRRVMKKLLLIFILVIVSNSAVAEWVFVAETDKENFSTFYADPTTIRRSGNNVKMWVLDDFSTLKLDSLISIRSKNEYACKEKQWRVLFIAFYSEHMGGGGTVLVYSEPEARWQQHLTGSVANIVLEYACSFRPQLPQTIPDIIFS